MLFVNYDQIILIKGINNYYKYNLASYILHNYIPNYLHATIHVHLKPCAATYNYVMIISINIQIQFHGSEQH